MAKIKINDYSEDSNLKIVSPTQAQMDEWMAQELAEAEQENMLGDEAPTTLFADESID